MCFIDALLGALSHPVRRNALRLPVGGDEHCLCERTHKLGLTVAVNVTKITDFVEIAAFGIFATAGIMVDGKVVRTGRFSKAEDLAGWLGA